MRTLKKKKVGLYDLRVVSLVAETRLFHDIVLLLCKYGEIKKRKKKCTHKFIWLIGESVFTIFRKQNRVTTYISSH
jgi:hypothetical protein